MCVNLRTCICLGLEQYNTRKSKCYFAFVHEKQNLKAYFMFAAVSVQAQRSVVRFLLKKTCNSKTHLTDVSKCYTDVTSIKNN